MKIIPILLMLFFMLQQSLNAQNLVQNGSFENYALCPENEDQVYRAIGWNGWCASPDYLNPCTSNPILSVPQNGWGEQFAADGNAYCGFYAYWEASPPDHINMREHIGQILDNQLIIGKKYFASIKVSLAGGTATSYCACNKIGIKFTTDSYISYWGQETSPLINNIAQIYTEVPITDTLNWTTISGYFVADSAYQYMVIGNFFDDINTDTVPLHLAGNVCRTLYYYIDDVVLIEDTTTSASSQNNINQDISVYTASGQVFIQSNLKYNVDIEIYNNLGQYINKQKIFPMEISILDLANQSKGYYFIRIIADKKAIVKTIFFNP